MQFTDLKNESCELHLKWANTEVAIPITTDIKERVRKQIETALQGNNPPYYQAANFYYDYDKNYQKALEYINKATEQNPKAYQLRNRPDEISLNAVFLLFVTQIQNRLFPFFFYNFRLLLYRLWREPCRD